MPDTPVIEDPQAVLDALDRAKKDAQKFREERDALQAQVDTLSSDERVTKYKQQLVKAEAKARLLGMGVKDVDRLVKYLNVDGVDLDDEGNLAGLDESIEQVKTDFPELFDKKRRVGGAADGNAQGDAPKLTGTEAQVARLFQRTG